MLFNVVFGLRQVVQGSHKANLPTQMGICNGDPAYADMVSEVHADVGDAIIFCEVRRTINRLNHSISRS
jgi:hypothetical protein